MRDMIIKLLCKKPVYMCYRLCKLLYKYMFNVKYIMLSMISYLKWILFEKKRICNDLMSKYCVTSIREFKPMTWKNGVKYFVGNVKEKKVFIKTGGKLNIVTRELKTMQYIKQKKLLEQATVDLYNKPSENDNVVIVSFIEGKSLLEYKNASEDISTDIIKQLYAIYCALRDNNIYHLDIRPQNFIVKERDGKVKVIIIDFGFALVDCEDVYSMINATEKNKKFMSGLGAECAMKNGVLDDAYSMLLTMKYVCPSLIKKHHNIWLELNNDIGRRQVFM